jgi:hypothetical protein
MASMQRLVRISAAFKGMPILGAVGLILLLNVLFHAWDPMRSLNPDTVPAPHTWAWWAVRDYHQQPKAPNVVLLGSSQMMSPVWWHEADFRKSNVELVVDHRSTCLEALLRQAVPGADTTCFNFALPGGMMSDACMVVKAMFHGDKGKPEIAVIGLSPREFMDNSFHCPAGTRHYQYLSRFCDTKDVESIGTPELPTRLQCWLQKILYFKFKSQDIQLAGASLLTAPFGQLYSKLPASPLDSVADADQNTVIYKDELQRGFWVAKPENPDRYLDIPWDCARRLGKPNPRMFENQKAWLRVCLDACRKENVAVVLVNMPVSAQANSLMGPGIYDRHVAMLQQISKEYDLPLIDANKSLVLTKHDFTDWSHMDSGGGRQLLQLIADNIASHNQIASRLIPHNSTIATQGVQRAE